MNGCTYASEPVVFRSVKDGRENKKGNVVKDIPFRFVGMAGSVTATPQA